MTPREMAFAMSGATDRWRREQALTYSLAMLVRVAFHDPRNFPSFEKAFPDGKPKAVQTDRQMLDVFRAWTIHLGGTPPPKVH